MMFFVLALLLGGLIIPPQSETPIAHWLIRESRYLNGEIVAATGPSLMVSGFPNKVKQEGFEGYQIADEGQCFVYPWTDREKWSAMPKRDFTISVRFSIPDAKRVQGVAACIFQPQEGLAGWRIAVRNGKPEFTVAKPGMTPTVLLGKNDVALNKVHRIDASYDGTKAKLFVDGDLQAEGSAAFGDLIYNGRAGICFADWWEGPRSYSFEGSLFESALWNKALSPAQVTDALAKPNVVPMPKEDAGPLKFVIEPFFQYPTSSEATVVWETSKTSTSVVRVGLSAKTAKEIKAGDAMIHKVLMPNLKPATTYFVQTESVVNGEKLTSKWKSFRTGSLVGTPVKFAVVGDTQDHPEVNTVVGKAIFAERPDSVMIVGDLVGMGWNKREWEHDFFASLRPLFDHVPLLPVMGNHDRNARIYYDLMSAPAPTNWYRYQTGDVEFFVIDTNQSVQRNSPQYRWLEDALKTSTAKWKIAAHHHPPYSSDNDDFGDSDVEPTTEGELEIRPLTELYDKYGVDLCFAGHIHSYERTFPLKAGKVVEEGRGTVYLVVGGGGGDLETPKPTRSTFSRVVRYGHHFGMVTADSQRLEFRAYDEKSQLFDTYVIKK